MANQKLNLKSGLEHPAPYPKELIILPILQTSRENDLVLDPFMGSGTTLKVASELGRRVVGYDIQNYLEWLTTWIPDYRIQVSKRIPILIE